MSSSGGNIEGLDVVDGEKVTGPQLAVTNGIPSAP